MRYVGHLETLVRPEERLLVKGPLDGLLIADFSRLLAGPHATMLLGDLGTDVVKVEHPEGDDARQVTLPALAEGRRAAGRCMDDYEISGLPFVVTGTSEEEMAFPRWRSGSRSRSTPRPRPTGRCWRLMAGATCRLS